jgi:hypothetical protein
MELKEVVVVNNLFTIKKIQKSLPCCLVCFEQETPQKFFVVYDLECGCKPYLHDSCVEEWFAIARREACPDCGQKWETVDPCSASCQKILLRCCLLWSFTAVIAILAIYVYQLTRVYN